MDRGMGGEQIGSLAAMPWASITFWVGKACAKDENRDMAGHARGAPRCSRFGVGGGMCLDHTLIVMFGFIRIDTFLFTRLSYTGAQ